METPMRVDTATRRLTALLYILMRDDLPVGRVAQIVKDHVDKVTDENPVEFSNKYLEHYARELAQKLIGV
jgi:hypothetical protein